MRCLSENDSIRLGCNGAAQWLYDILAGQLNNVAITAMSLTVATPELVAGIAEELPSASFSAAEKLAWRIAISPAVGLANLASAGFFEAIDTGGYCAACVFIAIIVRDVVVSEGASYLCIYFAPATPAAVVGCVVFVEALIQFVSTYVGYTDVKDELCAGAVLDGLDPC